MKNIYLTFQTLCMDELEKQKSLLIIWKQFVFNATAVYTCTIDTAASCVERTYMFRREKQTRSAVAEMAASGCTSLIVKRWGCVSFRENIGSEVRIRGRESYNLNDRLYRSFGLHFLQTLWA